MTNREDAGDPTCDPRLAALLAVHLVNQVLDEAYVIVDAARESGQPWNYISMLKNVKIGRLEESTDENISFSASKGDSDTVNENKIDLATSLVATSTPQKLSDDVIKPKADASFIGQGDEELDMHQSELSKSTSMFISHLFDMSDVERMVICHDEDILRSNSEPNDLLKHAITQIMESYVNTALGLTYSTDNQASAVNDFYKSETSSTDQSGISAYSFMLDAIATDFGNDATFNINTDASCHDKTDKTYRINEDDCNEVTDLDSKPQSDKGDGAFYENYLTLNRDYDQCSDVEGPELEDPKGMMLQEVELITANTSDDNISAIVEPPQKSKELLATSAISAAASGSRKSSLASRCRTQGARLLACLRGWWRRKTPGKRKEARMPGAIRGLCPLSPDARRRAASLLDHREMRSPSPSRHIIWKFNTVNEALVNSSRWKNYAFDTKPDDVNEF